MKKAMISQPMNGKSMDQVRAERANTVKELEARGYEVLDTVFEDYDKTGIKNTALWCLGRSLQVMSECDGVYFMEGWQGARGCKIEHDAALAYGLEIIKK